MSQRYSSVWFTPKDFTSMDLEVNATAEDMNEKKFETSDEVVVDGRMAERFYPHIRTTSVRTRESIRASAGLDLSQTNVELKGKMKRYKEDARRNSSGLDITKNDSNDIIDMFEGGNNDNHIPIDDVDDEKENRLVKAFAAVFGPMHNDDNTYVPLLEEKDQVEVLTDDIGIDKNEQIPASRAERIMAALKRMFTRKPNAQC